MVPESSICSVVFVLPLGAGLPGHRLYCSILRICIRYEYVCHGRLLEIVGGHDDYSRHMINVCIDTRTEVSSADSAAVNPKHALYSSSSWYCCSGVNHKPVSHLLLAITLYGPFPLRIFFAGGAPLSAIIIPSGRGLLKAAAAVRSLVRPTPSPTTHPPSPRPMELASCRPEIE